MAADAGVEVAGVDVVAADAGVEAAGVDVVAANAGVDAPVGPAGT